MDHPSRSRRQTSESLIYTDELTGIYNRRYLRRLLRTVEHQAKRNVPFSIVMVDIDHFKEINDTYGHPRGDNVLREFAQYLKSVVREVDTVARYGGDEFVCVMMNTDRLDTYQIYQRILERCKRKSFDGLNITVSAGIASYPADGEDFRELLKMSDEALYEAKRSGRDRIGTVREKRIELPTKIFVDKQEERNALTRFLIEERPRIRVAVIEGNVGIGKTRMVKEVLGEVSGQEILWSDCLAFSENIPYYPIREVIRYKIKRQGPKIIENIPLAYRLELGKLVPEVKSELKGQAGDIDLVLDRYRLYESIRMIIELGLNRKIIVIDNMQWSDHDSTEAIKYLLRSLVERSITFIFIYRQEEKKEDLEDFTSYISRETEVKKINLGQLEPNCIKEMVKLIIGEEPEAELVHYVAHASGGNPFFIEEMIKTLNNNGYLRLIGNHWYFETSLDIQRDKKNILPKSIEDVTKRRYYGLSREAQELIGIASVVGYFDVALIRAITGYNEGHIIGLMEKIKRSGLISGGDQKIEFSDEISRVAIYRNEPEDRRRMIHNKVGRMLELHYQRGQHQLLEELALHYYHGGERERGFRYCIDAGDRARDKYAIASAFRYYSWAEELLRNQEPATRRHQWIECLLKRSEVLSLIGNSKEALEDITISLKEARSLRSRKTEADCTFRRAAIYLKQAQYRKALREAERSIKLSRVLGDRAGMTRTLNIIANVHWLSGKYDRAQQLYERALQNIRRIRDKELEVKILNNLGNTYQQLGNYKKALGVYKKSLSIKRLINDHRGVGLTMNNIGLICHNLGDLTKAQRYFGGCLEIMKEVGDRYGEASALNNLGLVYMASGEYFKALKHLEDSLRLFRDIENRPGEILGLNNIGIIQTRLGNYQRAQKIFQDTLELAKSIGDRFNWAVALNSQANCYMNLGDTNRAMRYLGISLRMSKRMKASKIEIYNLMTLATLNLFLNRLDAAKSYCDQARAKAEGSSSGTVLTEILVLISEYYLQKNDLKGFQRTLDRLKKSYRIRNKVVSGNVKLLLGRYFSQVGDYKKADRNLKGALAVFDELGEQLSKGKVYYYLGLMNRDMNKEEVAQISLKQALTVFHGLGAEAWVKRVKVVKV